MKTPDHSLKRESKGIQTHPAPPQNASAMEKAVNAALSVRWVKSAAWICVSIFEAQLLPWVWPSSCVEIMNIHIVSFSYSNTGGKRTPIQLSLPNAHPSTPPTPPKSSSPLSSHLPPYLLSLYLSDFRFFTNCSPALIST